MLITAGISIIKIVSECYNSEDLLLCSNIGCKSVWEADPRISILYIK